ncbi:hypothetical protein CG723_06850 [Streptomyces sp. CB01635]|uniref:hypothetical protein n=1 Tax=unclassified Streptomyces TaxID=2593676 RepID=UPI000C26F08A|nr:hypothetical protein [Streptomyces sp. CB01635]PJN12727.1 hypothetical protein CG723_06850 [Streptomyces sp. CB01635]
MAGIGPVEPEPPSGDGTPHTPAHTDTLWAGSPNSPHLHDRWAALPPHLRRTLQALLAAAAITGAYAYTALTTTPATPAPTPWPSQVTFLHYEGTSPPDPHHPRTATFRFTVSVRDTHPVTIRQVRAGLPGLSAHAIPALPLTVKGGAPKPLTVRISVYKCAALPPGFTLPHLDLGLRNRQAQQQHSYLFGGAFPRDLATYLHDACGPRAGHSGPPRGPRTDLTRK